MSGGDRTSLLTELQNSQPALSRISSRSARCPHGPRPVPVEFSSRQVSTRAAASYSIPSSRSSAVASEPVFGTLHPPSSQPECRAVIGSTTQSRCLHLPLKSSIDKLLSTVSRAVALSLPQNPRVLPPWQQRRSESQRLVLPNPRSCLTPCTPQHPRDDAGETHVIQFTSATAPSCCRSPSLGSCSSSPSSPCAAYGGPLKPTARAPRTRGDLTVTGHRMAHEAAVVGPQSAQSSLHQHHAE